MSENQAVLSAPQGDSSLAVASTQTMPFKKAVFFALSGLVLPIVLGGQGAVLAFSAGWSAWLAMVVGSVLIGLIAALVVRFSRRHLATGSLMSYVSLEAGTVAGTLTAAALFVGYIIVLVGFVGMGLVFLFSFLFSIGVDAGTPLAESAAAIAILFGCALLARRGASVSGTISVVLAWVGMPFVILIVGLAAANHGVDLAPQLQLQDFSWAPFSTGVVLAFSTFVGFEGFTALAAETKNPQRTIPKVVVIVVVALGLTALTGIFLTVPIMLTHTDELLAGASPLAILSGVGGVPVLGVASDLLLFLAVVASLIVFVNGGGRIVGTAARDGMLPRWFGAVDSKRGVPMRAIVLVAALGSAGFTSFILLGGLPLYATYITAATMTSYPWLVAYLLVAIAGLADSIRRRSVIVGVVSVLGGLATIAVGLGSLSLATGDLAQLPWIVLLVIAVFFVAGLLARRRSITTVTGSVHKP